MTLPNFLIIGAMKSGTTSLHRYLGDHPDVFMASPKELHFFSYRGGKDIAWYEGHFASSGAALAVGEASASYTTYPDSEGVPARIAAAIPDVRLIYLVRHPIERMRSHYLHRVGEGSESAPIEQALLDEPIYLRTSLFAERIEQYLEFFPLGRILVEKSEDLQTDRLATIRRIFAFVGVDDRWTPSNIDHEYYTTTSKRVPRSFVQSLRHNALARGLAHHLPGSLAKLGRRTGFRSVDSASGHISADLTQRLEDQLREDVLRLRNYAGEGFDGWGII